MVEGLNRTLQSQKMIMMTGAEPAIIAAGHLTGGPEHPYPSAVAGGGGADCYHPCTTVLSDPPSNKYGRLARRALADPPLPHSPAQPLPTA